jgi:hypothetical protein
VLRAVLPPLVAAYAVFVAMVVLAQRRPVSRPHGRGDGSVRVPLRRVVRMTVGGYVAFLVIVLILHVWLRQGVVPGNRSGLEDGAFGQGCPW